jgi:hypothetical protein
MHVSRQSQRDPCLHTMQATHVGDRSTLRHPAHSATILGHVHLRVWLTPWITSWTRAREVPQHCLENNFDAWFCSHFESISTQAVAAQFGDIIANHVVVSQTVLLKRAIGEGGHQECVGEGKRTVQCLVSWRKRGPHADGVSFLMMSTTTATHAGAEKQQRT